MTISLFMSNADYYRVLYTEWTELLVHPVLYIYICIFIHITKTWTVIYIKLYGYYYITSVIFIFLDRSFV